MQTENIYLYSILIDNNFENLTKIKPEYLLDKINQELFNIMQSSLNENSKCDIDIVKDVIYNNKYAENMKKMLMARVVKIEKLEVYPPDNICEVVKENYVDYLNNTLIRYLKDELPVDTKIKKVHEANRMLLGLKCDTQIINYQESINDFIDKIDSGDDPELKKRSIEIKGYIINKLFGEYIRPVVYILAGLPGFCKTQIIMNIINRLDEVNKKGLIFSFEDPIEIWQLKKLAVKNNIELENLINFNYSKITKEVLQYNKIDTNKNNIWVSDNSYHINDFITEVDRQMIIRKYDYIVIDYIELFRYNHRDEPRELKLIMNELRRISIKYLIPVIVLSQLDRNIERDTGSDVVPVLKDLYGSSGLEKAARRIMMIGGRRDMNEKKIYIRKSTYTALYEFDIVINKSTGKINDF